MYLFRLTCWINLIWGYISVEIPYKYKPQCLLCYLSNHVVPAGFYIIKFCLRKRLMTSLYYEKANPSLKSCLPTYLSSEIRRNLFKKCALSSRMCIKMSWYLRKDFFVIVVALYGGNTAQGSLFIIFSVQFSLHPPITCIYPFQSWANYSLRAACGPRYFLNGLRFYRKDLFIEEKIKLFLKEMFTHIIMRYLFMYLHMFVL